MERQYWDFEPFSGAVVDGVIYGRGALDMKSMGIMELMAMFLIKRHRSAAHARHRLHGAGRRRGGRDWGIEWMERNHPELLDAEYVINEGGWGRPRSSACGGRRSTARSARRVRCGSS